ncbi:AMP-binding protein [Microbulbifer sp. S227A]|uniref:AMP-binding protein n=1 Tax=Microbulbifer sp. S227A TaxID=3415131 RepID=UPI003C7CDEB3
MAIIKSRFPDVSVRDLSITERVFEGLGDDPDRVILIDGPTGREVTVGRFVGGVKSLAGGLNARGLGAGACVALMAPNLPEYCVVFHGVAWAGGTITTINPTYTAQEVRHQLSNARALILITVAPFLDTARAAIRDTEVSEIYVIGEAPDARPLSELMGPPQDVQTPVDLDEHVLALPYSSGTTGLPKGVMLTHRSMVMNVDQTLHVSDIEGAEFSVAFLPFFHIYGMQVLINMHLAAGAGLVTMPRFDLEQFLELCAKHRTRRMWIVPPIAIALAKHPIVDKYDLSAVEYINSGAAPLGGEVTALVGKRLNCVAAQGYGMTELSPVSHLTPPGQARTGASGVTAPNTECRIVSTETGADLEPGQSGELWVRGPQVMKGYLNNPEATAAALDQDGWLHTGDIGHFDTDGYLYITDRLKELIKFKGFQVAPAELEAELLSHPEIADVAVVGAPDAEAGEVPMAFVVPVADATVTLGTVQGFLAGRLSPYKQVQRMEIVSEIPKSAAGKILRRVLRDRLAG